MTFYLKYGIINIGKKKESGDILGKKISEEIIEQIPILYKEYGTKKAVAEKLNISVSTVNKYLNLYEAAPVKSAEHKKVKIDQDLIEEINKKYQSCQNMAQVARELGIAATTVKKYLSEKSLKMKDQQLDDRDALWYYIYRLFGQYSEDKPVSDWNITQMQKFKAQGMSYRAQLLTLKYFYEVRHESTKKANGSIGIIPYIYQDSYNYYRNQAKKADELGAAIQKQLEKDRIEIKYNPSDYIGKKRKKKLIDLSTIEE